MKPPASENRASSISPGPLTRALQDAFQDALYGRNERYLEWLDVVTVPARASA